MSFTLSSSGACTISAGANVSSSLLADSSKLNTISDEVEGYINTLCRYNVVGSFASLTSTSKNILASLHSALVAQKMISYDMSGYTNAQEADQMLNVLENTAVKCEELLTQDKSKKYLGINSNG